MTLVHNLLRHRYALLLPCAALAGTTFFFSPRHAQAAHSLITQFQGCPADGQTGPVAAPTVLPTPFALAAPLPAGLTLYASQDLAAVGPVGWHCLQLYGSSGTFLMLRPEAFPQSDRAALEAQTGGPGIQVSSTFGTTSGRFDVARTVARAFPNYQAYVQSVIQEGIEPASHFPSGPYPDDQITREGDRDVAFTTPPHTTGFGTESRLIANNSPIQGLLHLTTAHDLMALQVRLPPSQSHLTQTVIEQTRKLNADFGR